jgi:hypothetical protein
LEAGESIDVDFSFLVHLTRGQYHAECHVFHVPTQQFLSRRRPAAVFSVDEHRSYAGVADLELDATLVTSTQPQYARADVTP